MTSEEFLDLNPRQLGSLSRRHRQRVENNEFLFAQLTAHVVNFSARGPKEPLHAKDFMPSQWRGKSESSEQVSPIGRRRRTAIATEASRVMQHFVRFGRG